MKTIFYEQEKDHGTSSRIVSIAKLFCIRNYLVIANAISNSVNTPDRGLLYIVQYKQVLSTFGRELSKVKNTLVYILLYK